MIQNSLVVLEEGSIVEAVYDSFVQSELAVKVLLLHHGAIFLDFQGAALAAEGAKDGEVTEVVQMVINGRNAQAAHGGEEHRAVEGADFQQEAGKQTEVVQQPQEPHSKLQEDTGDHQKGVGGLVKVGIQGRILNFLHRLVHFVINIGSGVVGAQMDLDHGFGRIRGHFLLDGHTELQIVAAGVDLLSADEAVDLGVFAGSPAVASQQHMGQAKVCQTFPALLTDVALHIGDLKGLREQIVGIIALGHNVGRYLIHGRLCTDAAAIRAVAPGGMILTEGMALDRKAGKHQAEGHQAVSHCALVIAKTSQGCLSHKESYFSAAHKIQPMQIGKCRDGYQENDGQKPGKACLFRYDLGVQECVEDHHDGIKHSDHSIIIPKIHGGKHKEEIKGDQPDGDCGLIKPFFTADDRGQRIKQGGCYRQKDLAPPVGTFLTDQQDAGHCRADHAKHHQPGQQVFLADIKSCFSFHTEKV